MRRSLVLLAMATLLAACASPAADEPGAGEVQADALVGGKRDTRWAASGYLVKNGDLSKPTCGATLIAPNAVMTAAHCVIDDKATFAFGTGDVGSSALVRVVARRAHPEFHPEAKGWLDITHLLRNYDVAVLRLEHDVAGVVPAELPSEEASMGCDVQALGYRVESGKAVRVSTPACVMFQIDLGNDPIFEVHPSDSSALCVADGDDGSAVVRREGTRPVLVGIFVGSVTGGATDCRRGTQFLNGYESAFGYRDFLRDSIVR